MNLKQILIVGIIFAILTIGAVSASEDLISDDNLTVSNEDDSIVEIDESTENDLACADDNENLIGGDDDDYRYVVSDTVYLEDESSVVYFHSYNQATGTLQAYVDGSVQFTKEITSEDYDEYGDFYCDIYPRDLGIASSGYYDVKLTLNGELLDEKAVRALDYYFYIDIYDNYVYSGDDITGWISLPSDIANGVTITANGKSYNLNDLEYGRVKFSISSAGWNVGYNEIIFTYDGDNKYHAETIKETVEVKPEVNYPYYISLGEQEFISISAPGGNGNAVIYAEEDYEILADFPISNGYGSYSLANLPEGYHVFIIEYDIGSCSDSRHIGIEVIDNNPDYSSSISSTEIINGNDVAVTLTGPSSSQNVHIYIDDDEFKSVSLTDGKINVMIPGLAVGTHKIRVLLNDDDFYSKTYYVTVKSAPSPAPAPAPVKTVTKLTLKKVKVKKSAKKLAITATLKINGKAVKGKIIKFKFNKKSYKAKTNKKGVAKITVKKAVLKKLKVGKKVKYQAKYGKITKKVTVKVKK